MKTFAIVIGVSFYLEETLNPLPAAEIDAVHFARALKNWGIPEEQIFLLLNDRATETVIFDLFQSLDKIPEPKKLVFYFAGHGYRSLIEIPHSYLLLHHSYLEKSSYLNSLCLDELIHTISTIDFLESYIFIDACHLRVNTLINPQLKSELNGVLHSQKSLFCLFSGIGKSYEDAFNKYGFFTAALLKGLAKIRLDSQSPTQLFAEIQSEMEEANLPIPNMINFGTQKISFEQNSAEDKGIQRDYLLADIQDRLILNQTKILLLYGEQGCGKSSLCASLQAKNFKIFYYQISAHFSYTFTVLNSVFKQNFGCNLDELEESSSGYLLIIDQIERLDGTLLKKIITILNGFKTIKTILVSQNPLEIVQQPENPICDQLEIHGFTEKESFQFLEKYSPELSVDEREFLYLVTQGNPQKLLNYEKKKFLFEFSPREIEQGMQALYGCGECYDKVLFENVFKLKSGLLDFFESNELLFYLEDQLIPHPFIAHLMEKKAFDMSGEAVLTYWFLQAQALPYHQKVAKSLILAVKCFGYQKNLEKVLKKAFQCISIHRDNLHYFLDGADIYSHLTYRTGTTVFLAKVLMELDQEKLALKLLSKKRKTWIPLLILPVLLFFLIFSLADNSPTMGPIIHIKQIHPDFVGREYYLDLLHKNLVHPNRSTSLPIAVLWGEGGIGKSEIAITFANKNTKSFDLIYWIEAGTFEGYLTSYQHLASLLKIPFQKEEISTQLVRKVHDYLENQNQLRWLLIYDNAETEFELPQRGKGAILVTTRNRLNWHLFPNYEVSAFKDKEAIALIHKITHGQDSNDQKYLVKELENYPLSINLAAHYIAETPKMSEKLYLEMLRKNNLSLLANMPVDQRYPQGLLQSWKFTTHQLKINYPIILEWLHFCAYLYPDQIPSHWINEWLTQFSETPFDLDQEEFESNKILRLLVNQSIVRLNQSQQHISLHRLKQEILKNEQDNNLEYEKKVLKFLISSLDNYKRYDEMERNPQIWPKLKEWELHAAWFLEKYSEGLPKDQVAFLNNLLGCWKMIQGEYPLAGMYIDKSLTLNLEHFGKYHLETITTFNNKAWNLWKLGRLVESKSYYLEALSFLENLKDPLDQPTAAFMMNNLSLVLKDLQDYPAMKEFNEKALMIRQKYYGDSHPYTADSMHNLGISYQHLNELDFAKMYLEMALASYQKIYGQNHPYVIITLHNIARTLLNQGEYQSAETYFTEVCGMYSKMYGEDHPYTALCYQNLGQVFTKQGKLKEALVYLKKAFINLSKIYSLDHLTIVSIMNDLKELAQKSGNNSIKKEIQELGEVFGF